MYLSSLNSIAEVGIGINLAFALLEGIRVRYSDVIKHNLNNLINAHRLQLSEIPSGSSDAKATAALFVRDLKDIAEDSDIRLMRYQRSAFRDAIELASFLLALLLIAALSPDTFIPWYFGPYILILSCGSPLRFGYRVFRENRKAKKRIDKKNLDFSTHFDIEKRKNTFLDDGDDDLTPTPPE